jgi:hypothetical protein
MSEDEPLYTTEAEALHAPGEIYRHFKGGIYRIVQRGVKDSETLEPGIVYEHLWPRAHAFWYRPESSFFSKLDNGETRFRPLKKATNAD